MNILESANIRSPNEIEEECAHFTITDTEQPFVLNDIAKPDEQYTFSAWVKGSGEISISGNKFQVTEEWTRCVITFISDSTDVEIYFRETGEYYFYNSQLEIGEKDTDYSPAPEDLEADAAEKADNALASAKTYADAQIKASADSVLIAVSQSYATVGTVSGVEKRVTDAEALIEVQAGLIEQKVDVDGVIAAINLFKGEARIAADKITLAGYTIADAFTCTNLTVAGDSTFSGVLNGATGNFSGVVNATDFKLAKSGNDFKFAINTDGDQLYLGTDTVEDITVASLTLPGGQDNAVLYGYYGAEMKTDRGSIKLTTGDLGSIILTAGENVEINSHLIMDTASANSLSAGIIEPTYLKWYPSSNTNFNEVQLRLAGSTGTQGIAFVTVKNGSAVKFYNIVDSNGDTNFPQKLSCDGNLASGGYVTGKTLGGSQGLYMVGAHNSEYAVSYVNTKAANSSGVYFITVNGRWGTSSYASHNIVSASSDIRLKENFSEAEVIDALSVINQIQMYSFDWKETGAHQKLGFVADELETIDPHLAFGGGYDMDGSMNVKTVDTFYLLGYLTKGIQELSQMANTSKIRTDDCQRILESMAADIAELKEQLQQASA